MKNVGIKEAKYLFMQSKANNQYSCIDLVIPQFGAAKIAKDSLCGPKISKNICPPFPSSIKGRVVFQSN